MVVKQDLPAVVFIRTEVVEQHAVPLADHRDIAVHRIPRIDTHSGDVMTVLLQFVLDEPLVLPEPLIQQLHVLLCPKGKFQGVVAAVKGETVAGLRLLRQIGMSRIVLPGM